MSDVILSIAIFHSLCALTLIASTSLTALRSKRRPTTTRRLPVIARPVLIAQAKHPARSLESLLAAA